MQVARRTVTLFRNTHRSIPITRGASERLARSSRNAARSHPRHFLASPSNSSPHVSNALVPTNTAVATEGTSASMTAGRQSLQQSTKSLTIGLASGTLGAMCGIGGAVFAIPAMVRFKALPQKVAAGNSLVAVTAVAIAGAASFQSADSVDTSVALPLALTATAFTPVGARLASHVNPSALRKGLGAFMLFLAPALPIRGFLARRAPAEQSLGSLDPSTTQLAAASISDADSGWMSQQNVVLSAAGAAVGITSGLLGISGGSLFTPLIATTCPDMPFRTVMGTTFAAMIVPTAAGALTYARMGLVTPAALPALVVGAGLGAKLGANVALSVPDVVLHYFFAAVFAVMGLRTLRAPVSARPQTSTPTQSSGVHPNAAGKST